MPTEGKKPLNYDDACNLFMHEFVTRATSGKYDYKEVRAFQTTFIDWLSGQGYYLSLSGDEFLTSNFN